MCRVKPELTEQAAVLLVVFSLYAAAKALDPFFILIRQLCDLSRLAVSSPHFKKLRSHKMDKIIHFILVAAMKDLYILHLALRVSLIRVKGQVFPVSFRTNVLSPLMPPKAFPRRPY